MDPEIGLIDQKRFRGGGRAGPHVEVWHTGVHHLSSGAGIAIRYQYTRRRGGVAEVLICFVSRVPSTRTADVAATVRYSDEQFASGVAGLPVRVGACAVTNDRVTGMIDAGGVPATWDIVSRCVTDPLALCPTGRAQGPMQGALPHPFLHAGGKVQIGNHQFLLNGDPGHQAHFWGEGFARGWTYISCSSFLDADGVVMPAYVAAYLEADSGGWWHRGVRHSGHLVWGEDHVALSPAGEQVPGETGLWRWEGVCRNEEVAVTVTWSRRDEVVLRIPDSTGSAAQLETCTRADCEVQFHCPGHPPRTHRATGSAYVEVGKRL